jgi:hypothetical protein
MRIFSSKGTGKDSIHGDARGMKEYNLLIDFTVVKVIYSNVYHRHQGENHEKPKDNHNDLRRG